MPFSESEISTRRVLDNIFAFVGVLLPDGTLIDANRAPLDAAGISADDVLGKKFWDCYWWNFSKDSQERLERSVARASAGEPLRYDVEVRLDSDVLAWIDFQLAPLKDEAGRVTHLIPSAMDITERKRAEAARLRSAEMLTSLIEQAPYGIYVVDSHFRLSSVNALALPTFANVRPLIGRDFAEVMHILWGSLGGELCAIFRRTLETGERYVSPRFAELRADLGEEQAFEWETQRLILPDGKFGVVCYFNEVTERLRAEAARSASERRFRETFENAAVGVAHIAPDGRWIRVNRRVCGLVGYSNDELARKSFQEITHPEDLDSDVWHVRRLLAGDAESYSIEKRYLHKKGSVVWGNLTVSVARDAAGKVEYFIAVVVDITERKAQQLALERSEARLRRIFASNVVGMIRWDLDRSLILDANDEFLNMTGYSRDDVREGRVNFRALTPPEWTARNEDGIRAIRENGFAAPYEKEYIRRDGSRVPILIAGTRFEDSPTEGMSFLIDISELHAAQQEILQLNARLKRSVAESHHRIKNNLQVLSAMIEMQATDGEKTIDRARLTRLNSHVRALASLHDILTMEQPSGADEERIPVDSALNRMIPMLSTAVGGKPIRSEVEGNIKLPLKSVSSFVLLVNELVSNAHKHGSGEIRIRLARMETTNVRLEVHDDGPGFPDGFDPSLSANTGLQLIESLGAWDLGGSIRYENRPEGGACVSVTFTLPVAD